MNRLNCRDISNIGSGGASAATSKTPPRARSRSVGRSNSRKTPASAGRLPTQGASRTPTARQHAITPSRNTDINYGHNDRRTPGKGDRFIPNRSATNFELAHFLMTSQSDLQMMNSSSANNSQLPDSPRTLDQRRLISEHLNGGVTAPRMPNSSGEHSASASQHRILAFREKPQPALGYANGQSVLYVARKTPASSCKKAMRHIPTQPERILDAPDILDDYYLNLIDWGSNNILAVALGSRVYLWHAGSGEIEELLERESGNISSVSWVTQGQYLAIGLEDGSVLLYDVAAKSLLRTLHGHSQRVGALAWNSHVLSSGCRDGSIHHYDVRKPDPLVAQLVEGGHTQEVCGLRWSPDGRYLASGGNDNRLIIWPSVVNERHSQTSPLHVFTDHCAAVKAVAWCPWQPSILASGGGTADRHIRLWNINTGQNLRAVDTESQVCALLWSNEHKELISAHGFPNHDLNIWKYPSMAKIANLTGHTERILNIAMSPDGQDVVSASGDESLRIWRCFGTDPAKKKTINTAGRPGPRLPPGRGTMTAGLR